MEGAGVKLREGAGVKLREGAGVKLRIRAVEKWCLREFSRTCPLSRALEKQSPRKGDMTRKSEQLKNGG